MSRRHITAFSRLIALTALLLTVAGSFPSRIDQAHAAAPSAAGTASAATNPIAIGAGYDRGMAIAPDGGLWTWGGSWLGRNTDIVPSTVPGPVPGLTGVKAVAGSWGHTIALTTDGSVWAWGNDGALVGAGDSNRHPTPAKVPGLTGVTAIAAGDAHSLAVKSDGTLWAWGVNQKGEVSGWPAGRYGPMQSTLTDVVAAAAGEQFSVAVKSDGTVWTWGINSSGQLGDGTFTDQQWPAQVPGLTGVVAVASGGKHTLALKADGTVWAWGSDGYIFGDPAIAYSNVPMRVPGLADITAIATGEYGMALASDGTVWTWGGIFPTQAPPVAVEGLPAIGAIAAGYAHNQALGIDGSHWAWGGSNQWGQFGDASNARWREAPGPVLPLHLDTAPPTWPAGAAVTVESVTTTSITFTWPAAVDDTKLRNYLISRSDAGMDWASQPRYQAPVWNAGTAYTFTIQAVDVYGNVSADVLTLTATSAPDPSPPTWAYPWISAYPNPDRPGGLLITWGKPQDPEGIASYSLFIDGRLHGKVEWPDPITERYLVADLEPGVDHTFKVEATDASGNTSVDGPQIAAMVRAPGPIAVAAGLADALAVGTDGSVWGWGQHETPQELSATGVVQLAGGDWHSVALRANGSVWTWGVNDNGQLGRLGSESGFPNPVSRLAPVTAVAAGSRHSLALQSDGTVWAWGANNAGQLGDGTTDERVEPVRVANLSAVKAIASAPLADWSLALRRDGTVWAWGSLPAAGLNNVTQPRAVPGLTNVVAIAAGAGHGLAVKADGTVWSWGVGTAGQLGDGARSNRAAPVRVKNLTGVTAVAGGNEHSLALRQDGTVWAWGSGSQGQLGDGRNTDSVIPVPVKELADVTAIAAGGSDFSLAVRGGATVWAWGSYPGGTSEEPAQVSGPWVDWYPPEFPANSQISVANVLANSAELSWTAAVDPGGVARYQLYVNDTLLTTVPSNRALLTGLEPNTDYRVSVEAGDYAGHWSHTGPSAGFQTAKPDVVPPALLIDEELPRLSLLVRRGERWSVVEPEVQTGGVLSYVALAGEEYALAGEVTEPLSKVYLDGREVSGATIAGTQFRLPIAPKVNKRTTFKVEAADLANNRGLLANLSVLVDPGPSIKITDPMGSKVQVGISGELVVEGTASQPLSKLAVETVDGPAVLLPVRGTIDGTKFTITISLPTDHEETYKLRVVGYSSSGLASAPAADGSDVRTATVNLQVPEPAVITSPVFTDGTFATNQRTIAMTGTAQAGAEVWVQLAGDPLPYAVKADSKGKFSVSRITLGEGRQELTVTVHGAAGNHSAPLRLTVLRDLIPPVVKTVVLRSEAGQDVGVLVQKGATATIYVNQPGTYSLVATFSEPLARGLRNGKPDNVQVSGPVYQTPVTLVKAGSTAITAEVLDAAGNSSRLTITAVLDTTGPKMTVQAPAGNVLAGTRPVTFSGSASEPLSAVRVVDPTSGAETDLSVAATIDARDPRKWFAVVAFPATASHTWTLRFDGVDLAGNVSVPDAQGKDIRTVISDMDAPVLQLLQDTSRVLFTGRDNKAAGVVGGKLTVSGTVTDAGSGVRSVAVGRTTLTPKGTAGSYDFKTAVTLTDGALSTVTVTAADNAGNQAPAQVLRALLKTGIRSLTATATHDQKKQRLRISGGTDRAVLIDGEQAVIIPVAVTVAMAGPKGELKYTGTLDGSTAEYTPATGAYSLSLDTTGWAPGKYTVTVKALAPAEFPGLQAVLRTVTVTVK